MVWRVNFYHNIVYLWTIHLRIGRFYVISCEILWSPELVWEGTKHLQDCNLEGAYGVEETDQFFVMSLCLAREVIHLLEILPKIVCYDVSRYSSWV